jgi:hypothetical protein
MDNYDNDNDNDDKRSRDVTQEHLAREPSSRKPRMEPRAWLAAPAARRQPRVGADYQIASLPAAAVECGSAMRDSTTVTALEKEPGTTSTQHDDLTSKQE